MENSDKNLKVEGQAIDTMLEKGIRIKSGFIYLTIKQSYLGTLVHISKYVSKMKLNDLQLGDINTVSQAYVSVHENALLLSKIVAIAVLNGKIKIKLFTWILSKYLLWNIKPDRLLTMVSIVILMNNSGAFMNSIRLIHTQRITAPKGSLIESPKD